MAKKVPYSDKSHPRTHRNLTTSKKGAKGWVIVAFGFRASPASWFSEFNINTKNNGLVIAEEEQEFKFQTSNEKIFSGGDMVRGSDLVVTAIWEGREAGKSIIKYLS